MMRRRFLAAAGVAVLSGCGARAPTHEPNPTPEPVEFDVELVEPGYVNDVLVTGDSAGYIIALGIELLAPSGYVDIEVIDADGRVDRLTIPPGREHVDPTFVPALEPPVELVERGAENRLLGRTTIEVARHV